MNTWIWIGLLIVVIAFAAAVLRFDVLLARWRELNPPPAPLDPAGGQAPPQGEGMRPHAAPVQRPPIHRSGKRH
jgi:hypothetical protein